MTTSWASCKRRSMSETPLVLSSLAVTIGIGFLACSTCGVSYDRKHDYGPFRRAVKVSIDSVVAPLERRAGVTVDRDFRTGIDHLHGVGRATRTGRSQAIISAGQGGTAAIDILSRLKGADVRDFDEPPNE